MKEKICCILDSNERYAVKLMEYCNDRRILPYRMCAHTDLNSLLQTIKENQVVIVLVAEDMYADLCEMKPDTKIIELCEGKKGNENSIDRYQAADQIIKKLAGYIGGHSLERNTYIKIYGVYSPVSKCFKTTFSLSIANYLGRTERTLFVSLEEFAGLSNNFLTAGSGLSDAMYIYKIGIGSDSKLVSCTGHIGNFDYLRPVDNPDDTDCLSADDMYKMLVLLAQEGNYQNVVIDISNAASRPWEVLDICNYVYVPQAYDYQGREKLRQFENYINANERLSLAEKIVRVSIPYCEEAAGKNISMDLITGKMEDSARRAIDV